MGRTTGTPRPIRKHKRRLVTTANNTRRTKRYRRGNPTLLLKNEKSHRTTAKSRVSRYKNFSVWGSGAPEAPVLSVLTPRLRHEILTATTQDLLFRNRKILQEMLRDHRRGFPFQLHGNNVKFVLVIAHGYIVSTMPCPRNIGIFHMAENDARNNPLGGEKVVPVLNTILGEGGTQFSTFLTSKLGTIHSENPIVDSVAYSTFGPDRMPEYHLWKTGNKARDRVDNITGVFDITSSLQSGSFDPSDFNYALDDRTPEQRRPGRYRELLPLTELLRGRSRHQYHPRGGVFELGAPLGELCRIFQHPDFSRSQMTNYDNSLCFMFVICCTGIDPTLSVANASAVKSAFPAYTSYAVPS